MPSDPKIHLLRHSLATLAYRGGKTLRGAPSQFESFRAAEGSRTAGQILAHIGDLLDWGLALAQGRKEWHASPAIEWEQGRERFHAAAAAFDACLASGEPLSCSPESLFQGPVADALTHVGQIAMLRRLAGAPVKGENYFRADITMGRVGSEQTPPFREFA